ncbi:MAG: exodeoxyribonuclease VII large subunit, partial [Clostridia bacterium]|nr:exodeoxyribonuclease VII large subunit [Clostridia bacterium]
MSEWILAVSDLNEYVRRTLAADPMLRSLRLRGEISNFKRHTSGHWYFTLKDEHSRINCVMFRQNAMRMSLRPMDGMQVILTGSVSLYAEGGQYQFYAENMRPDGLGTLYQQFEALKSKLAAEGLFDAGRKRPLPLRPRKIAVVTSRTGAVLQDIRNVSARRDAGVPLVLLPVQVQGEGAAESIAAAIRKAGTLSGVDVIITGRGGGSMEDLWAFNEEIVARAIAESPIP